MSTLDRYVSVPLHQLAHCRTGDKGDISNISAIAWNSTCYSVLKNELTEARVAAWFADREPLRVTRYDLPELEAFNFVIEGVLDGGVNNALNLDAHGKALSFHLLDILVSVPSEMLDALSHVVLTENA